MCAVVFQYKDFLDRLTPMEWFDQQRQLKKDRQARRRQARMDAKRQAWEVRTRTVNCQLSRTSNDALLDPRLGRRRILM